MQGYRDITASTVQLLLADTRLAATSLAQIVFLTIIAAFASLAMWVSLVSLLTIGMLTLGLSWLAISFIYLVLHGLLLLAAALAIRSCSEGLHFTASRKILQDTTTADGGQELKP